MLKPHYSLVCAFIIIIVFDPRIKLTYYEIQKWESEYINLSKQILSDTYNKYYNNTTIMLLLPLI